MNKTHLGKRAKATKSITELVAPPEYLALQVESRDAQENAPVFETEQFEMSLIMMRQKMSKKC